MQKAYRAAGRTATLSQLDAGAPGPQVLQLGQEARF